MSVTRDDAPLYLAKYARRRAEPVGRRSRARPTSRRSCCVPASGRRCGRSRSSTASTAPPGRTEEFARETVSPREQFPGEFRKRITTSIDVRLIRHGQTQGYITDGALTPLGRWQAHRKGQDLAKGLKEGMTVRFPHAPTARATRDSRRRAQRCAAGAQSLRHPRRQRRGAVSRTTRSRTSRCGPAAARST